MYLREMIPGNNVNIYITRDGNKYRVASKIEAVGNNRLYVTLISRETKVFQFLNTDKIDILYKHGKSLYLWHNVKAGVTELDYGQVHYFVTDKKGAIYNRRNAFRVEYGIPLVLHYFVINNDMTKYRLDDDDDDEFSFLNTYIMHEDIYEEKICQGLMRDLSESGIGLYANESFSIGEEIWFTLATEFGDLKFKVEVVRKAQAHHPIYQKYYGCIFVESNKYLPKYIINLQRKLLHITRKEE